MKTLRNIIDLFKTNNDVIVNRPDPVSPEAETFKNIENMTVEDLMQKRFIILSPTAMVKDVLNVFNEKSMIEGVVVDGGKLIGVISYRDILKLIEEVNLKYNKSGDQDTFSKKLKSIGDYKISNVIKDKIYVFPKVSLFDAIIKMDENNVIALPVIDDNGYIVGLLTEHDIVKRFLAFLNE